MSLCFEGLKIALPPGDKEVIDAFQKLQGTIRDAGGELSQWSEAASKTFTHVVAIHTGEQHAVIAKELGQNVVSLLWLLESVNKGRLLPIAEERLYSANFKLLPTNPDMVVATTGYQGIHKVVYGKMMWTLGLSYTKHMNPKLTRVVVSTDVTDTASAKVNAARENGIPVVSILWLYDCLRQGALLPVDEYTCNPAASMDPAKGALAMDTGLQVVANSDAQLPSVEAIKEGVTRAEGSEGGVEDSQPEAASRVPPAPAASAAPPPARTQEEEEQAGKDMIMARFEDGLGVTHPDEERGGDAGENDVAESTPAEGMQSMLEPGTNGSTPQPRPSARGFVPPRLATEGPASRKDPLALAATSAVAREGSARSGSGTGRTPANPAAGSTGRSPSRARPTPVDRELATTVPRPGEKNGGKGAQRGGSRGTTPGSAAILATPQDRDSGSAAPASLPNPKEQDGMGGSACGSLGARTAGGRSAGRAAAAPSSAVPSGEARGGVDPVSPEILAAGEGAPAKAPSASDRQDSYADISQQVLRADEVVGILVGAPKPANGNAADGEDETDDDLDPGDASGRAPSPPKQKSGGSEAPPLTSAGPAQGGGTRGNGRIPVNSAAPLASQEYQEQAGDSDGEDGALPGQQWGRPADGAVLWKAAPLGRSKKVGGPQAASKPSSREGSGQAARMSNLGRGSKRKAEEAVQDPLLGRTVQRNIQQKVFKGVIKSVNPETDYYRVVYEDSESEELTASEVHTLVDSATTEGRRTADRRPAKSSHPPPLEPAGQQGAEQHANGSDSGAKKGRERGLPVKAVRESAEAAPKRGRPAKALKRDAVEQAQQEAAEEASGDENHSPLPPRKATPARAAQQASPVSSKRIPKRAPASANRQVDKRPVFTVSGMHSNARERAALALRSLAVGSSIDLACHQWNSRCTHVLVPPGWIRGAKVIAAMASGAWLLSDSYLTACSKAHGMLEEEDYEIEGNQKNTVSKGAPKHWRLRKKLTRGGAFQGLKAVVHGDLGEGVRPRRDEVVSILTAGGATIIKLAQALTAGAHFCVTKAGRSAVDAKLRQLQGAGLCIVTPSFVVEWMAHPWTPPTKCVAYKSKMGAELTAAALTRGSLDSRGSPAQPPRAARKPASTAKPKSRAKAAVPPPATEMDIESQLY